MKNDKTSVTYALYYRPNEDISFYEVENQLIRNLFPTIYENQVPNGTVIDNFYKLYFELFGEMVAKKLRRSIDNRKNCLIENDTFDLYQNNIPRGGVFLVIKRHSDNNIMMINKENNDDDTEMWWGIYSKEHPTYWYYQTNIIKLSKIIYGFIFSKCKVVGR